MLPDSSNLLWAELCGWTSPFGEGYVVHVFGVSADHEMVGIAAELVVTHVSHMQVAWDLAFGKQVSPDMCAASLAHAELAVASAHGLA